MRSQNSKLKLAQKKVMLDHLGIPFADIPSRVGEVDGLLDAFMKNNPEQFTKTFDLVVHGKLPDGFSSRDKGFAAISELISEFLEPMSDAFNISKNREMEEWKREVAYRFEGEFNRVDAAFYDIRASQRNLQSTLENVEVVANRIALKAIEEAAKRYEKVQIKVGNLEPVFMDEVLPKEFERIVQLAANRVNVMLVGPSGCGKTHISEKVAKALNLEFAAQSCSAGMSESQLAGWLLPIGDSGKFTYVQTEFIRMYENGGVFLFDEIDAADANVLILINSALANGSLYLPQRYENPIVKRHKDFVAIAAANTWGGGADAVYTARNALDGSTLDRFRVGMVGLDYSDAVESSIGDKEVVMLARKLREKSQSRQNKENNLNKIHNRCIKNEKQLRVEPSRYI